MRLHVGGLVSAVSSEDVKRMLEGALAGTASTVTEVSLIKDSITGTKRGFGYATIAGADSEAAAEGCIKCYNGTKWKGCRLKVAMANGGYMERLQREWSQQEKPNDVAPVEARPSGTGIRSRVLRLRRAPGSTPILVDPSPDVVGRSDKGKEVLEEEETKWASHKKIERARRILFEEDTRGQVKSTTELWMNGWEDRHIGLLEGMAAEPAPTAADSDEEDFEFVWSSSDNDANEDGVNDSCDDAGERLLDEPQDKRNAQFLFGDDEGDAESVDGVEDDLEKQFEHKDHFEGSKGMELLAMERRFGGDSRFALDKRFLEDGESNDHEQKAPGITDYEAMTEPAVQNDPDGTDDVALRSQLLKERRANMGILSALFGTPQAPRESVTRVMGGERYDPTAVEDYAHENVKDTAKVKRPQDDPVAHRAHGKENFAEIGTLAEIFRVADKVSTKKNPEEIAQDTGFMISSLFSNPLDDEEQGAGSQDFHAAPDDAQGLHHSKVAKASRINNVEVEKEHKSGTSNRVTAVKIKTTSALWPVLSIMQQTGRLFMRTDDPSQLEHDWRESRRRYTQEFKKQHQLEKKKMAGSLKRRKLY